MGLRISIGYYSKRCVDYIEFDNPTAYMHEVFSITQYILFPISVNPFCFNL